MYLTNIGISYRYAKINLNKDELSQVDEAIYKQEL